MCLRPACEHQVNIRRQDAPPGGRDLRRCPRAKYPRRGTLAKYPRVAWRRRRPRGQARTGAAYLRCLMHPCLAPARSGRCWRAQTVTPWQNVLRQAAHDPLLVPRPLHCPEGTGSPSGSPQPGLLREVCPSSDSWDGGVYMPALERGLLQAPARLHAAIPGPAAAITTSPALAALRRPFHPSDPPFGRSCSFLPPPCALCACRCQVSCGASSGRCGRQGGWQGGRSSGLDGRSVDGG